MFANRRHWQGGEEVTHNSDHSRNSSNHNITLNVTHNSNHKKGYLCS